MSLPPNIDEYLEGEQDLPQAAYLTPRNRKAVNIYNTVVTAAQVTGKRSLQEGGKLADQNQQRDVTVEELINKCFLAFLDKQFLAEEKEPLLLKLQTFKRAFLFGSHS